MKWDSRKTGKRSCGIKNKKKYNECIDFIKDNCKRYEEDHDKVKKAKEKYEKMVFFCEKYKMPYMVVDTSNLTPDQTVEIIMRRIEGRS